MARPKEVGKQKWGSAYEEKCFRETEKLRQKLASLMRHDMLQLLEIGYLSDIQISTPSKTSFNAHKCLIKARAPKVWHDVLGNPEHSASITLNIDQPQHLFQCLRFIYGEDNITAIDELVYECRDVENDGDDVRELSPALEDEIESLEEDEVDACCPLAKDILKMYLTSNDHDVQLKVNGVTFKAHKCMLCARSGYFAAMLSGPWTEKDSGEIELIGVSTDAIQPILMYMYGAMPQLDPIQCNLTHILAAADMYGLCGLKEAVAFALRRYYCHFFHKPCADCASGILQVLPLAHTYGLEDLFIKALKWTTRYFARIWSNKQFSSLPQEIQQKCVEDCISGITTKTVIETVVECDRLMGSLNNVRWSEPLVILANQVMEACRQHLRAHIVQVMATPGFTLLGTTMALGLSYLGDVLCGVIEDLPLENACKAYVSISNKADLCRKEECSWNEDFKDLIFRLEKKMFQFMQAHVNQLVASPQWHSVLTTPMQTAIKESAYYVSLDDVRPLRKQANTVVNNTHARKPPTSASKAPLKKKTAATNSPVQSRPKTLKATSPASSQATSPSDHQSSSSTDKSEDPPVKTASQLVAKPKLALSNGHSFKYTLPSTREVNGEEPKASGEWMEGLPKGSLFERIESSSSLMTFCSTAVTVNSDLATPSPNSTLDEEWESEPIVYRDYLVFPLVWTFALPTDRD